MTIKGTRLTGWVTAAVLLTELSQPGWGQASADVAQTAAGQLLSRTSLALETVMEPGGLEGIGLPEMDPAQVSRVMQQRRKLFLGYVSSGDPLPKSIFIYEGDQRDTVYLVEMAVGASLVTRGWGPVKVAAVAAAPQPQRARRQ